MLMTNAPQGESPHSLQSREVDRTFDRIIGKDVHSLKFFLHMQNLGMKQPGEAEAIETLSEWHDGEMLEYPEDLEAYEMGFELYSESLREAARRKDLTVAGLGSTSIGAFMREHSGEQDGANPERVRVFVEDEREFVNASLGLMFGRNKNFNSHGQFILGAIEAKEIHAGSLQTPLRAND